MKNYKKENDFKIVGGIAFVVLCVCGLSTTTTLWQLGEDFKAGYEKAFCSDEGGS
ncbi:MAG: hypothetical protein ACLSFA_18330 [Roseburia inulinivorans]